MNQKAKNIFLVGTFLLVFAASAVLTRISSDRVFETIGPAADNDDIRQKLRAFEANKDEFDAVFVGPSVVDRQVDPQTFDERVKRHEPDFKSFNLGFAALNWQETNFVLDRIIEMHPRKLKYIFLEATVHHYMDQMNWAAMRVLQTHDLHYTGLAMSGVIQSGYPLPVKLNLLRLNLQAFLGHILNIGVAQRALGATGDQFRAEYGVALSRRGYDPVDGFEDPLRKAYLSDRSEYNAKLVALANESTKQAFHDNKFMLLQNLVQKIRIAGFSPVIISPPILERKFGIQPGVTKSNSDFGCPTISFADPKRYKDFYLDINRWDFNHLNPRGAQLFSAELADAFLELL